MVSRLFGQNICSSLEFDSCLLDEVFFVADDCIDLARGRSKSKILEGAQLCSLFFEASTRTKLSFDAAFMRLGGKVSHTTGVTFSSLVKGESIRDTARVISGYCDICVFRHGDEDALEEFVSGSTVPVMNAGNGSGEHPTQALLDMYTIRNEYRKRDKQLAGSTIALAGDLCYGRTVHSLVGLLGLYSGIKLRLISPLGLGLPNKLLLALQESGHEVEEFNDLREGLTGVDLVYMTRVQKERIPLGEREHYEGGGFRLDRQLADESLPKDSIIMHPLPRDSSEGANDLSQDVIEDDRLAIFRQSDNGVPIRMALFAMVFGVEDELKNSMSGVGWSLKGEQC